MVLLLDNYILLGGSGIRLGNQKTGQNEEDLKWCIIKWVFCLKVAHPIRILNHNDQLTFIFSFMSNNDNYTIQKFEVLRA